MESGGDSPPAIIKWGIAVLVIGGLANVISSVTGNPFAGYGFALLVVMAYAAVGGRAERFAAFFRSIAQTASGEGT